MTISSAFGPTQPFFGFHNTGPKHLIYTEIEFWLYKKSVSLLQLEHSHGQQLTKNCTKIIGKNFN